MLLSSAADARADPQTHTHLSSLCVSYRCTWRARILPSAVFAHALALQGTLASVKCSASSSHPSVRKQPIVLLQLSKYPYTAQGRMNMCTAAPKCPYRGRTCEQLWGSTCEQTCNTMHRSHAYNADDNNSRTTQLNTTRNCSPAPFCMQHCNFPAVACNIATFPLLRPPHLGRSSPSILLSSHPHGDVLRRASMSQYTIDKIDNTILDVQITDPDPRIIPCVSHCVSRYVQHATKPTAVHDTTQPNHESLRAPLSNMHLQLKN